MTAEELRIGNWVSNGEKNYTIDVNMLYDMVTLESYQMYPIPLTPEILEKCGFEKLPGSKNVFRIFINSIEISVNPYLAFAYIDTNWGQASIKNPIFKYLHQLQNLYFALTQTELIYKP